MSVEIQDLKIRIEMVTENGSPSPEQLIRLEAKITSAVVHKCKEFLKRIRLESNSR